MSLTLSFVILTEAKWRNLNQYRPFDYAQGDLFKARVTHSTRHSERNEVQSKNLLSPSPKKLTYPYLRAKIKLCKNTTF